MPTEIPEKKERLKQNSQISIATSIYYPNWYPDEQGKQDTETISDKIRGDIFFKMVQAAKEKGFQLTVVDASDNPSLTERLNELSIRTIPAIDKRMGPSRQQAFKEASKLENVIVIVWIEPEKISMVKDCLPLAALPILSGKADVVVPERSSQSFLSLPDYQSESEMSANQIFRKMLVKFARKYKNLFPEEIPMLDIFFGVKLFKNTPELLKIFTSRYEIKNLSPEEKRMDPDLYNNALNFPVIRALNEGYEVKAVQVPYHHPKIQTEFEKNNLEFISKRKKQFSGILRSCAMFCRYLAGTETRIVKIT